MSRSVRDRFDLTGRVAVITGGGGMLGREHAAAVADCGGIPVLVDIDGARAESSATDLSREYHIPCQAVKADITNPEAVERAWEEVRKVQGRVDILINNAASNPQVKGEGGSGEEWSRFENFSPERWDRDLAVGLTGAYLCSRKFGSEMARQGRGVILNIASDLSVIAPDQRIYRKSGIAEEHQPVKPVSYSVVKAGLVGLTRYLATYWASRGVRVNALSPGGVEDGQPPEFVQKLTNLIPMGRMAEKDEYRGAIAFLCSDASAYMTGVNLVIDGGRTAW